MTAINEAKCGMSDEGGKEREKVREDFFARIRDGLVEFPSALSERGGKRLPGVEG